MHHKFWLMCVFSAVLCCAAVPTDTGQIMKATSTETVQEQETTPPRVTTLLPSRSAATRNVSINTNTETNTNTESSHQLIERQRALDTLQPTRQVSQLLGNTKVVDSGYVCDCQNAWTCICRNSTGKVESVGPFVGMATWTFQIDGASSSSPILVKVYFYVSDIPTALKNWKLYVGSKTTFEKATELRNKTEVYILSNETIQFNRSAGNGNLKIVLYYEALVPDHVTETIPGDDMSGIIRFPTNASNDVELGYIQQHRQMWIFNYPENYIVELNLTKLDLGYRQADMHWKNTRNNETANDFLLIGLGIEIMESMDKVLYGHLDERKTIRINHPSAHIVMFSSYHEQWAGGFEVSYAALEVTLPSSTTTSAPTTVAPQLGVMPSTLAPIDGAQKGNFSAVTSLFRSAVSGMATEYVSSHKLDVESPSVIEPSDVVVYWTATCLQNACSKYCVAFNFSIHKTTKAGTGWAFSTHTLDLMIRDEALQPHWKVINDECEFCEEVVTVNWYVFGGVAAGAVLLAVIISLVVWKIKNITAAMKSKEEIEADQKLEKLEGRRRSSGDESVIGGLKGGARMSLPFGGARGSVNSENSSQNDETDDYPEHDPDFGYDNFGLGADLLNDNKARNFYSNAAFEPDTPPSNHIGYKQLHQAVLGEHQPSTSSQELPIKPILKSSMKKRTPSSQEADGTPTTLNSALRTRPKKVITVVEEEDEESFTDSDESDGAVQFKSVAFKPKKQISIQADVHHPGDSDFGETVL